MRPAKGERSWTQREAWKRTYADVNACDVVGCRTETEPYRIARWERLSGAKPRFVCDAHKAVEAGT